MYKLYTHLTRFTGLSQRPCTTSAVRTLYNTEVAEGSFTIIRRRFYILWLPSNSTYAGFE